MPDVMEHKGRVPKMIQKHVILGRDRRDAEAKRDRWLSEHPKAKILRLHPPKAEPITLLMRIGGWNVPRVSIEVDYEWVRAN